MGPTALRVHTDQSPRLGSVTGVLVREDTLFTNHEGTEKGGIRKRAEKGIEKLQDVLRKVLEPEEAVLYLARCWAPLTTVEQLTLGIHAQTTSRMVLVFTTRRLLLFFVHRDGSWTQSLRALRWGDAEEAKAKGWPSNSLTLRYRSGEKEKYTRLRGTDAKKVRVLLTALLAAPREGSAALAPVSLCPACWAQLTPGVYRCPKCNTAFKTERAAFARALLIPGGAYFYTAHSGLGILHVIAELYLMLEILAMLFAGYRVGESQSPVSKHASTYFAGALFFLVLLFFEKSFSFYHCRRLVRRFIPA